MILPVNPSKVLRLFSPLWLLLALSLWLNWEAWQADPITLAFVAALPIVAAIAGSFVRDRWRLELTPAALIHHTLGRREQFEWSRMGAIELKRAPVLALFIQTFWFAYPTDAPQTLEERASTLIGRRILCVFGDHGARETITQIEEWRALNAR